MEGALIDLAPGQMLWIGILIMIGSIIVQRYLVRRTDFDDFSKLTIPLIVFGIGFAFVFWGGLLLSDPELAALGSTNQTCHWVNDSTTSVLVCRR
jgi:hypothetical protein